MAVEVTPQSGERGGSRPKLRSLDVECSTVEVKKGTKNDTMDQKGAVKELKGLASGEYNVPRKPFMKTVRAEWEGCEPNPHCRTAWVVVSIRKSMKSTANRVTTQGGRL